MYGLRGVIHELYRCGKIGCDYLQWGILRLCDFWSEISSVLCISVLNSRKACTEYYSSLEKQVGFDERFEFEAPSHISISKLKQFPDRVWSKNREYGVSLTFGPGLISITPFGWNEHTLTKILRGTPSTPSPTLSFFSPWGWTIASTRVWRTILAKKLFTGFQT